MNLATLMACATCGHTLTDEREADFVAYRHPVSESDRHQATPVDAGLVKNVFHRCHICSGPHPVWHYRTGLLEAVALGGDRDIFQTYNTQWHVCCRCAQLVEADDKRAELHWMQPFDWPFQRCGTEILPRSGPDWVMPQRPA